MTFYEKIERNLPIGHNMPVPKSTNGKDDILSFAYSEVRNSMLSLLYDKSGTFEYFWRKLTPLEK